MVILKVVFVILVSLIFLCMCLCDVAQDTLDKGDDDK